MARKELSDQELFNLSQDFARLNLVDRDNVVFDFEADIKRVMKTINLQRLINKDKKYLRQVKLFIRELILQSYLKDMINVGLKKTKRFNNYYVAA